MTNSRTSSASHLKLSTCEAGPSGPETAAAEEANEGDGQDGQSGSKGDCKNEGLGGKSHHLLLVFSGSNSAEAESHLILILDVEVESGGLNRSCGLGGGGHRDLDRGWGL